MCEGNFANLSKFPISVNYINTQFTAGAPGTPGPFFFRPSYNGEPLNSIDNPLQKLGESTLCYYFC